MQCMGLQHCREKMKPDDGVGLRDPCGKQNLCADIELDEEEKEGEVELVHDSSELDA